jgi:hypothetical protein
LIGRDLSQQFATEEWGGKIIDRLAGDLQIEFPVVEGLALGTSEVFPARVAC